MAKGIRAFQALLNRIVAVPKEAVEKRMEQKRAKRIKQRSSTDNPPKK